MTRVFRQKSMIALSVLLALAATSCRKRAAGGPPPRPPVVVQTAVAVQTDAPNLVIASGATREQAGVDMVPQVSGVLVATFIADGAVVTNGQPLFLIDPRDYALRVRQAESLLAADAANLELSRLTAERTRPLREQKLVSQEDYDTLTTRVVAVSAQVHGDEATLDQARLNLARCTVTAPLGGICSRRYLDNGNLAAAGQSRLVNIRSYDPLLVDFAISEQYLPLVRDALREPPVRLELTPRGETNRYAGTLVFMDNAVNPLTGTILLRGQVPNPELKLWAQQFVEVRLYAGAVRGAVLVPEGAIQYGKQGAYLFAVNAATQAEMRVVQTGVRVDDLIQVRQGVAPGERVVVLGQLMLYPGATVVDLAQMPHGGTP